MKVMAQIAMVMNLDKCIGCHTCSVTCKQTWTNRSGTEYMWFNNVETRPGGGYPRGWENQERWKGGWKRKPSGKLIPRSGGRLQSLAHIFANPSLPELSEYYEPWTYEYDKLLSAPRDSKNFPVARPVSQITGEPMDKVEWGPNWDDDLGGGQDALDADPVLSTISTTVKGSIEQSFMFYLPRICEHCLNPTCVAACPSGAIYKRNEDGIILVDQDRCRGWRMCVSACPYKKVYFNHQTGKAEKCTLCYPRLEIGQPTVCSETCVGRLRYLGVMLYDADKVASASAVEDEKDLYQAQLDILLDPFDPNVIAGARTQGISTEWLTAAQESPIYALIKKYKVALPLHPEYRTMPMVWYVPPLSPVVDAVTAAGADGEDHKILLTTIANMRIPLDYLAELFTAGDTAPVELALRRLAAMRSHMRNVDLGVESSEEPGDAVGMSGAELEQMYRLLAIAKYDDRYVIPMSSTEPAPRMAELGIDTSSLSDEGFLGGKPAYLGVGAPEACSSAGTCGIAKLARITVPPKDQG
jgi:nitrate reductase beta subunit